MRLDVKTIKNKTKEYFLLKLTQRHETNPCHPFLLTFFSFKKFIAFTWKRSMMQPDFPKRIIQEARTNAGSKQYIIGDKSTTPYWHGTKPHVPNHKKVRKLKIYQRNKKITNDRVKKPMKMRQLRLTRHPGGGERVGSEGVSE